MTSEHGHQLANDRERIGLYIHIPFCTAKCSYCDFNSYVGHDHTIPTYTQTLLKDAALWREAIGGRVYGMEYNSHSARGFSEDEPAA